eukprot:2067688-Rhodomonas_salina.1
MLASTAVLTNKKTRKQKVEFVLRVLRGSGKQSEADLTGAEQRVGDLHVGFKPEAARSVLTLSSSMQDGCLSHPDIERHWQLWQDLASCLCRQRLEHQRLVSPAFS